MNKKTKKINQRKSFKLSDGQQVILGVFLVLAGTALFISFLSFLYSWKADQSELYTATSQAKDLKNFLNRFGNKMGHFFIYKGFGISSILLSTLLVTTGRYFFFGKNKKTLFRKWFWTLYVIVLASLIFGFFSSIFSGLLSGSVGYQFNALLSQYVGKIGTLIISIFFLSIFLVNQFKITTQSTSNFWTNWKTKVQEAKKEKERKKAEKATAAEEAIQTAEATTEAQSTQEEEQEISIRPEEEEISINLEKSTGIETLVSQVEKESTEATTETQETTEEDELKMEVEVFEEEEETDILSNKLVEEYGEYDPRLDLSKFEFPGLDLLKDYSKGQSITINQEELEENKNRIVETLSNYKIGIDSIKATVGPTVTLYEIVPEAGIRISKIKNLEDDIALSLSALGIRIIAPIPGRGTIGIEVPNKDPKMVSMRSVIASSKFQNSEMELPVALGKTISNETYVVDLAKMPHLLMAGATGQGKSVGLNVILTSLLYKKHPAEVKFVLIDPKKVELTLFNKIERHYLAKLPDSEEAIITDTTKVVHTLNSLTIEMDNRYEMLKNAMVRNIKEYNAKFKERKLNPNDGHAFLPYIVLVIDEFADLIMTAGKEVETPIARLAQLARAVGIHLIVATQRPSVNVITGIIKANFPARAAFRVTSKIDSRTILDGPGADQLIGRGDMLYTQGNEVIRIQCAFVDTPEIDKITDFIGSQRAYPTAYELPEYSPEDSGTILDDNPDERDSLFEQAAEVLIIAQQGSTSLLQRKLRIGYNRAGRIIDQLEAAGVVGPFEGSRARQVLIPTMEAFNQLLRDEEIN